MQQDHPHHRYHPHNGRQRMLEFTHPFSGKRIHVIHTPQELAEKQSEIQCTDPNTDQDIVFHGSPEHIQIVETLRSEHTSLQEQLREKHGEAFQLFDTVRNQLDNLDAELHLLTDHAVSLDASFGRFGYSAHLRTLDSGTASLDGSMIPLLEDEDNCQHDSVRFFKRPRIRQYFHKGLVWRSSRSSEVAAFELFIDLVYVGVIDVIGQMAVDKPIGVSLLHFVIAFSIAAKIWCDMTMIINWFDINDVFQRITFAYYLMCLFGYTINISSMFKDDDTTYKSAIAFYLAERLCLGFWYLAVGKMVPMIRGAMGTNIFTILVTASSWITSIHVGWAAKLTLIFLAILLDLFGNLVLVAIVRRMKSPTNCVTRNIVNHFEFSPAINIEHRVERNDAFVTLVFGYSVLTILYQSSASFGINAFFGKGVLGLIQAFVLHWIYFEIDLSEIEVHAIRRHWAAATVWVAIHVPFVMAYVLSASTLSRIVLAHDSSDSDPLMLTLEYSSKSIPSLSSGLRWFYCGGLGCSIILMAVISYSHRNKRCEMIRISKDVRLIFRCCIGAVMIGLARATSLRSLELVAITSCLSTSLLVVDIYGTMHEGHSFWTGGMHHKEKKSNVYTADVKISYRRRREIKSALLRGENLVIHDLWKKHSLHHSHSAHSSGTSTPTRRGDEEWVGGHY